jgi:hypothetical protein
MIRHASTRSDSGSHSGSHSDACRSPFSESLWAPRPEHLSREAIKFAATTGGPLLADAEILWLASNAVGFTSDAVTKLAASLDRYGEFLPRASEDGDFSLFNVLTTLDAPRGCLR